MKVDRCDDFVWAYKQGLHSRDWRGELSKKAKDLKPVMKTTFTIINKQELSTVPYWLAGSRNKFPISFH